MILPRRVRVGILVGLALSSPACTASIDQEFAEPVRPRDDVRLESLTVLPLTAREGSEAWLPAVTDTLVAALRERFPALRLVEPAEARERLGGSGALTDYATLVRDYEDTGVADSRGLLRVAAALDADHFLTVRVGYQRTEVLNPDLFDEDVREDQAQEMILLARLWEAGGTAPVWESVARAASETGPFTDERPAPEIISALVRGVVRRLPIRPVGAARGAGHPEIR